MANGGWINATGRTYPTLGTAKQKLAMLRRENPTEKFDVLRKTGSRGGMTYQVVVYLNAARLAREKKSW